MEFEFDPAKDEANVLKHGITLARAVDFEIRTYVMAYCLAGTDRDGRVCVISLRRAHDKEMRRHA